MNSIERKNHWENIFLTKNTSKVSWFQAIPETSLKLIDDLDLPKTAQIIEIGSGDSFMADNLLEKGYMNISLLDISDKALETIKMRLSGKSKNINFICADITNFTSEQKFDLWHDRAVFHFLKNQAEIQKYVKTVSESLNRGAFFIISTFSENGPKECSGLSVQQYNEKELSETFKTPFKKINCFTENHKTPSGGSQNFLFCIFQKL